MKCTITRIHDGGRNKPWLWWLGVVLFAITASYEILCVPQTIWSHWDGEAVLATIKEAGMQVAARVSGDGLNRW